MLWHKTGFFKSVTKVCKILQFHKSSNFLLQNKSNCGRIFFVEFLYKLFLAEVAELADAHGSGPCGSNTLWVRLPSSAVYEDP